MEKINLDVEAREWLTSFLPDYGWLLSEKMVDDLYETLKDLVPNGTVRDLCRKTFSELWDVSPTCGCVLQYFLNLSGLRIDMSNCELLEYSGKKEIKKGSKISDNVVESTKFFVKRVDWEQRRWRLAMRIFAHDVTFPYAINEADKFIKKYKESIEDEQ